MSCFLEGVWLETPRKIEKRKKKSRREMAVTCGFILWMVRMVWIAIKGWVSSCLIVADELASSLRTGDIGPLNVG